MNPLYAGATEMPDNVHTLASPAVRATAPTPAQYTIHRYGRFWRVLDPAGDLVCITVYKCGAQEVVHRLCTDGTSGASKLVQSAIAD